MIKRILKHCLYAVIGGALLCGVWYGIDAWAVNSAQPFYQRFGAAPISGGDGSGTQIGEFNATSTLRSSVAIGDWHVVTILSTIDCYIAQGESTDTSTYGTLSSAGAFMKKNVYVPVLVTYGMEYMCHISVDAGNETGTMYVWHHEANTAQ